ncbi:leucyl-tRNA synthetase [Clavulina sp. PMI_390]|nr:leucyl-tRNA synthetase [Clavulina sp. PMI_390]
MANLAAEGPIELQKTGKRDFLIDLEKKAQSRWASEKIFEVNAPEPGEPAQGKWLGTFPYPYMNGSLHLGHGFTISKVEFATGFQRMLGKRALFPVGFHCTGMPIKAAADKLVREIELFGEDFTGFKEEEVDEEEAVSPPPPGNAGPAPKLHSEGAVDKAKKGKLNAKSTGLKYQFQIMLSIGVPRDEIKKFADPYHWLIYFPPITIDDLSNFGARVDWRRSFITTDANPYYDSFVRWQINKLRALNKIKFGERYTIYSPKDGQPCMDHDRSEGEALGPQEYTGLKMEVSSWSEEAKKVIGDKMAGKKVFLVAATLRPETMYGQTNCFVGTKIKYGFFSVNEDASEVYVCTHRAARNMAFQNITTPRGKVEQLAEVDGSVLIGTKIRAPFGIQPEVYVLPMDNVLPNKGTGVVTSVPSDSPDDYATLMDLRKKPEYYKIQAEWASIDPIPVLSTPAYGDLTAPALVQKLKIQSQKDQKQLAEAKEIAYKEGFYSGTMVAGEFKGLSVQEAKPKVRTAMIEQGLAFAYAEPEGFIKSRSGDECVVSLEDQWYLDYGEEKWRAETKRMLSQMNTYNSETRHGFEGTLDWLNQWACARRFGLGSRMPWDQQFLVESLSDSTIYMSYYTVSNLLHSTWDGKTIGPLGVTAEMLTDEVWEYVLGTGPKPASVDSPSAINTTQIDTLKRSFQFFYPLDLRSSGKDLIPNHLTFALYNHVALFPEEHWPRSMRANGHLMMNGKKMSKSTGNSLTLKEGVEKFGADATRIALADAGDGIEDANFDEKNANAAILRLHTLIEWCQDMKKEIDDPKSSLRRGPRDSYHDLIFEAEMRKQAELTYAAYEVMNYKEALKEGFFELQSSRDWYREVTTTAIPSESSASASTTTIGMHADLIQIWMKTAALLVQPIAPHFAEHIWGSILGEPESIQKARWSDIPVLSAPPAADAAQAKKREEDILIAVDAGAYMRGAVKSVRDAEITLAKKGKKGAAAAPAAGGKKAVRIIVATSFPPWQDACVAVVKEVTVNGQVDDAKLKEALTAKGLLKDKRIMPFVQVLKRRLQTEGPLALSRQLTFDEAKILALITPYITATLNLPGGAEVLPQDSAREKVKESEKEENGWKGAGNIVEGAEPGNPGIQFWTKS